MKGILGKKLGMTQIFDEAGKVIPVTVVEAGPCHVVKKLGGGGRPVKLQLAFDPCREKNMSGAELGQFKKANVPACRLIREVESDTDVAEGGQVTVAQFTNGEDVTVMGFTKGRGFTGAMKRWNFHGLMASHGTSKTFRGIGSRGTRFPQHSRKGRKCAGRYGNERVTVKNLKIVEINQDENLIFLRGAIPGPNGGYVTISAK